MENKVDVITSMGYKKEGYGYKRVTDNNTHWITLFDDVLQMYSYYTEYPEGEKEYDTGMVKVSNNELRTLINVLVNNHI